jgi:hypothetical protein
VVGELQAKVERDVVVIAFEYLELLLLSLVYCDKDHDIGNLVDFSSLNFFTHIGSLLHCDAYRYNYNHDFT